MMAAPKRLTLVMPSAVTELPLRERIRLGDLLTLLIARAGNERIAFPLASVQEAVDAGELQAVPQMPDGVLGVIRWRGGAHPVWSPAHALRAGLDHADTALFIRGAGGMVALAVDDVEDLVTVAGTAVRAAQGVANADGLVVGVVHVDTGIATLIDPDILADAFGGRAGAEP